MCPEDIQKMALIADEWHYEYFRMSFEQTPQDHGTRSERVTKADMSDLV